MTGKIVPYIFIGLVQATIILLAALHLFGVPFVGSVATLYAVSLLFIAASLTVGITISSTGAEPAAGDAADLLLLPADDAAVGLHVSVPRHARRGRSGSATSLPLTLLQPPGARHPAQGQRRRHDLGSGLADRRLHRGGPRRRAEDLSHDARLTPAGELDCSDPVRLKATCG
jgi:hypothetical protein